MKNNKTIKNLFTWLSIFLISFLLTFCNKDNKNEGLLISNIDIVGMRNKNFVDFDVQQRGSNDSIETEYLLLRNTDSTSIFMTIGLYGSSEEAEKNIIDYINDISIHMELGKSQETVIGYKYWWWGPNSDFNNVTNIAFIRKNVIFKLSSHNYGDLKSVAKKIDNDILDRESYIGFKD